MRNPLPFLLALALAAGAASAAAAGLDLPVRDAATPDVRAPFYRGDVLEIRLAPGAARLAHPLAAGPTRVGRRARLGVATVDALGAALGATFEPEFRGEVAPRDAREPDFTAFHLVHLPPGVPLADALERFRALPDVAGADPIAVTPVSALPADSLAFATYWLENDRHPRRDIHAPEAWASQGGQGDTSIIVAIVDTGILPYHPDIGGRAGERGQMWINWAEKGGQPGVDDDGNGYVDDWWGWDFVSNGTTPAPGEDYLDEDNDPNDFASHGTALAGIIGAIAGNGIGLAGAVPNVRLMALRIGWAVQGLAPPGADVDMSYAAMAIRYATRMGASVINCSWTSVNSGGLDAAVTAATRAGVTIVNASGNSPSDPAYLGNRDDVIAVAGTDTLDVVSPTATTGPWVDLSAASVGITSTFVRHLPGDSLSQRTPYYMGSLRGTSFAAPQVTAAVALLQAQRRAQGRAPLTPAGVLARVRETADDILALNPGASGYGTGRLNLYRALTDPPTSLAIRGGARTLGPAVVFRYNTGATRVVYATSDRRLVAYDGASGDTAWVAALPAAPTGTLAGANLGGTLGAGLFVGSTTGRVMGFRDDGSPLPGWPVTGSGGAVAMNAGVAIGDLDGDGLAEIVCGGTDGKLWAWHADGSPVAGLAPFVSGSLGLSAPALGDLDGQPGAEIVVADGANNVHALRHDGSELANWPWAAPGAPLAPALARLGGPGAPPAVLVATGATLTALAPDAGTRWTATLPAAIVRDLALADLDGDGVDEIVATTATPAFVVLDSAGVAFAGRPGWPDTLAAAPQTAPVVGPLRAGHGPCVVYFTTAGLVARDDSAQAVPGWPKPGGAGALPSLAELDGDGATEIAAGAAVADSNVYTYDAGPGTWNAALAAWPTARGDFARTASHAAGAPGPPVLDRIRPAPVADLTASAVTTTSVQVRWTVSGDDSLAGRAAAVRLHMATFPLNASNFDLGTPVATPPPDSAGTVDSVSVAGLVEGGLYWFALRVEDRAGNLSALSNVDTVETPALSPAAITDLKALQVTGSSVLLGWTATGGDGRVGRPATYQVAGSPAPIDSANFAAAPRLLGKAPSVDAGAPESLLVQNLSPGQRWRFRLVAVNSAGRSSPLSNQVTVITPVGGALRGRAGIALAPRPQPARPPVQLDWQGDPDVEGVRQLVLVHDLAGRLVRAFDVGTQPGGVLAWDGRDAEGRRVPAGLYFVRIVSGPRHADARVILLP